MYFLPGKPALPTLPFSIHGITVIQSLDLLLLSERPSPSLPWLFDQSSSPPLLYPLNVFQIDPVFPHHHRINLWCGYFPCLDYYNILCVHCHLPYHTPPTLMPLELSSKVKIRPSQFRSKNPLNFLCTLWNLHVFLQLSWCSRAVTSLV